MKLTVLALALLFSFPTFGREKHHDVKAKPYIMFSFNRPSDDCFLIEPPRHSKGVAKWECAVKPARGEHTK